MLDILSVCVCVSIALFRCEAESGSKLLLGVRSEPKKRCSTIRYDKHSNDRSIGDCILRLKWIRVFFASLRGQAPKSWQNELVDHCQHIFQSILWFFETQNKETYDCAENCVMSRRAFSRYLSGFLSLSVR